MNKQVRVEVQRACEGDLPADEQIVAWVEAALQPGTLAGEVAIRIITEEESASLNSIYRGKAGPTNVLSFPFEAPPGYPGESLMGDLAICAAVVEREALEQQKNQHAHWAHMVVHGLLHLQGFDHLADDEARVMEGLEVDILAKIGYQDPYGDADLKSGETTIK